jgi:anhydro-N-acetylmuramic acid kinase
MSGTSMDGVDAALCDFSRRDKIKIVAAAKADYGEKLRAELIALNSPKGKDELHRAYLAADEVARRYALAISRCLRKAKTPPVAVAAAGCHGQTVRHAPLAGYSAQLLNGALLAELCGVDIVCDFRAAAVAAGGEGAPLAPAFHRYAFFAGGSARAVVNIGGIANITAPDGAGRDCGPGNLLMDAWHRKHKKNAPFFDRGGKWAASGEVVPALLTKLLATPFLQASPSWRRKRRKSCGREDFDLAAIFRAASRYRPQDAQATFLELTAKTIAAAASDAFLAAAKTNNAEVILCGGGAYNDALCRRIQTMLGGGARVKRSDDFGIPAKLVEATAFAWLAQRRLSRRPIPITQAAGANKKRTLGAIHPRPPRSSPAS